MNPRVRALLYDMQQAASLVGRFVADKGFEDYEHDPLLRSGVERQLEIIGEALSQLTKIEPQLARRITDHRRVIALRNILAHGYARIDHNVIWDIVENHLPALCREVDALLRQLPQA